jgi:hypothetical protein
VPAAVVVPEGSISAGFVINTTEVAAPTNVTLTGSYLSSTKTGSLTVTRPNLTTFTLAPTTVKSGLDVTGTVKIDHVATASGVTINLASSNNALATVPATVTIAPGATSATFTVHTNAGFKKATVNITASQAGGTPKVVKLTVTPTTLAVSASPNPVVGGNPSTGTVTLGAPAGPGGVVVKLTSSAKSVATVPATVTIAEGNTTATFTITTLVVKSNKTAKITAKATISATTTISVTK